MAGQAQFLVGLRVTFPVLLFGAAVRQAHDLAPSPQGVLFKSKELLVREHKDFQSAKSSGESVDRNGRRLAFLRRGFGRGRDFRSRKRSMFSINASVEKVEAGSAAE